METAMEAKSSANVSADKQIILKDLHAEQKKLKELQTELDAIESKINNNVKLSKEETKFIGELGWLSAAAVAIVSIASSV